MVSYTQDLLDGGLSYEDIRASIRRGDLVRLRRGVYRAAGAPALVGDEYADDRVRRHLEAAAATMLQLEPGACFSHVTAGLLHKLPVPRHLFRRVHITRPGRGGKVRAGVHLHRSVVPPDQIIQSAIGPATSLPRTTADLARTLAPAAAVASADVALRAGVDRAEVIELLTGTRIPNSVFAREVMRFADPATESVGESHSRWLIHTLGFPAPVLQQKFVTTADEFVARTDFWWPEHRLVGEFDGKEKYGRLLKPGQTVKDVIEAERRRENALRRLKISVERWTWADLDEPDAFKLMLTEAFKYAAKVGWR